jgi:molybdenum cofactor cytidylyltransferase
VEISPKRRAVENFSVIILAAGDSSRFGGEKLRRLLGGKSMLCHAIQRAAAVQPSEVIVVVREGLDEEVRRVTAPVTVLTVRPHRCRTGGIGTSLSTGISAVPAGREFVFVHLADKPLVPSCVYRRLMDVHLRSPEMILTPCVENERGHPVLFPRRFFTELGNLASEEGGRKLLRVHHRQVMNVRVATESVHSDIDSLEDYEEYCMRFRELVDST